MICNYSQLIYLSPLSIDSGIMSFQKRKQWEGMFEDGIIVEGRLITDDSDDDDDDSDDDDWSWCWWWYGNDDDDDDCGVDEKYYDDDDDELCW